jgi:hypothetical protein
LNLADAIAAAHAQNEAKFTAQVAPYGELDNEAQMHLAAFIKWCGAHGVRSLPATPASVAMFVMGTRPEEVAPALMAIQELHDSKGLPSPVATAAVRSAVSRTLKLKPPRSWRKAEQLMFGELPPEIRAAIERREQQRETELRRLMNQLTELKRHGGAKPAIEEKEITK